MWKIGNVEIKSQVVLAPMAGVCNNAYRDLYKRWDDTINEVYEKYLELIEKRKSCIKHENELLFT